MFEAMRGPLAKKPGGGRSPEPTRVVRFALRAGQKPFASLQQDLSVRLSSRSPQWDSNGGMLHSSFHLPGVLWTHREKGDG